MEPHDFEYFYGVLTESLDELLKKSDETVSLLLESTTDSSELMDQATHEANRNLMLRMRDRENRLIDKINQSLARLEDGTFGVCEVCGEDISIKRLKARPVTTYCISCKHQMETLEKAGGL
jgi:RNA polymerase-binding transcription factor